MINDHFTYKLRDRNYSEKAIENPLILLDPQKCSADQAEVQAIAARKRRNLKWYRGTNLATSFQAVQKTEK